LNAAALMFMQGSSRWADRIANYSYC